MEREWSVVLLRVKEETIADLPVFNTVAEARDATGANATMIFVPPPFAADAILEAVAANRTRHSSYRRHTCARYGTSLPVLENSKVDLSVKPQELLLLDNVDGIMPGYIHAPGNVGVMSRSGTLTYEAVWQHNLVTDRVRVLAWW